MSARRKRCSYVVGWRGGERGGAVVMATCTRLMSQANGDDGGEKESKPGLCEEDQLPKVPVI